jgi:hypothetical protein
MSHLNGAANQPFALLLAQAAGDAPAGPRDCDAERVTRAEAEKLAQARADILAIVAHDPNCAASSFTVRLERRRRSMIRPRVPLRASRRD